MNTLPTTIKAIATELQQQHPGLSEAIAEACSLLAVGDRWDFSFHDGSGAACYWMKGRHGDRYLVGANTCTCPAFQRRGHLCYHRVARRILAIRNANLTAIEWGEAIAAEEPPTPPAPPAPVAETRVRFVEALDTRTPGTAKRSSLSITDSMDALQERLAACRRYLLAVQG